MYKSILVFNGFTNLIMAKSTFIFSAPEYLIVDTSEEDIKGKYPPPPPPQKESAITQNLPHQNPLSLKLTGGAVVEVMEVVEVERWWR